MDMPVMPGLAGENPNGTAKPSLTELLDSLSDEEFAELQAEVGLGEEVEDVEEPSEATPPAEGETQEAAPAAEAPVDLAPVMTQADANVEEVAAVVAQLEQLRESAEENKATGGDPKGVDRLIAQANELQSRAEECRKLVEKAVSAEDSKAAVEEGIRGQQLVEQAQALIAQAKPMSEGASAAAGPDAEKAAAMKLWSDRVMAGG